MTLRKPTEQEEIKIRDVVCKMAKVMMSEFDIKNQQIMNLEIATLLLGSLTLLTKSIIVAIGDTDDKNLGILKKFIASLESSFGVSSHVSNMVN